MLPAVLRYTAHAELQLRAAAVEALVHTLHSSARLRSAVLLQVVVFLAALPDEAQQVRGPGVVARDWDWCCNQVAVLY